MPNSEVSIVEGRKTYVEGKAEGTANFMNHCREQH